MAVIDRVYSDNAVQARVVGSMTPSVPGVGGTFTVDDATGYPTVGKFVVKLNRAVADEEHVLISSRSGTTFTVGERGYGGTAAQSHNAPTCEIYFDAPSANKMVDHVDGTEANPHSGVLLNNAAHDITARHTFGAALGTPGTPTALTPDIAGSAGVGSVPARSDHAHNVPADTPVAVGTALSEGAGSAFARNNHVHTIGAGAINDSGMFAADVINAAAVAANAIGSSELADNAVDSGAIASGAVIAGKLAAGAINATNLFGTEVVPPTAVASEIGTFTPSLINVTIGTGGAPQNNGLFIKIGRIVVCWGQFILGTTGDVTGDIGLGLPENAYDPSISGFCYLGGAQGLDGTTRWASVGVIRPDTNPDRIEAFGTAGQSWDATNPFNWGAGDRMRWFAAYIAAAV